MRLPVSHAFHSPLVEPAARAFADELGDYRFESLQADVISTVTGSALDRNADLKTLLHEQIMKPVQFMPALRRLAERIDLLIEVGPDRILAGLAARTLADQCPIIPLDMDGTSVSGLLKAAGCAFVMGVPIRQESLFDSRFTRAFDPG